MAHYPFKHFETLVQAVRKFNPEAASWLETKAPDTTGVRWFKRDGNVDRCMCWSYTPQGSAYWSRVDDRLHSGSRAGEWDGLTDVGPCYANGLPIPKGQK